MDDSTLMQAVARRDESAFAELYDRFFRPVYSLIVRILRSRSEGEEVLQDAFWQVWERAGDYRPELGSAFCWIITIARRKAIDRLRGNTRRLQRLIDLHARSNDDTFVPDEPRAALVDDERGALVRAALARLHPQEKRSILLAFFDGLTHDEIALVLRIPVGTVKARIRRGMIKLRPSLAQVRQAGEP